MSLFDEFARHQTRRQFFARGRNVLGTAALAGASVSVATLILSGRFLGFLPDHYAEAFVRTGRMRAVQPALFNYTCSFSAITRRSPAPSRATELLRDSLVKAHGSGLWTDFTSRMA